MSHAPRESSAIGDPDGEIARRIPDRRTMGEAEYLALDTRRLVEFDRGVVEFLPWPTLTHQLILQYLRNAFEACLDDRGAGLVVFAGYRFRLEPRKYREPDPLVMLDENDPRIGNDYTDYADLVVEVVSESNREHDEVTKRAEYAKAGIAEYWIVDPERSRIVVLRLEGDAYAEHGVFGPGERATSALLAGFEIDAGEALAPRRR